MSDVVIRLFDVYRKSLDDTVDVTVTDHKTGRPVWNVNDAKGTKMVKVPNLTPNDVYVIRVRPSRHRYVGQFVRVGAGPRTEIEIVCPVDPSRVLSVSAPAFANLPQKAQQILGASNLEHPPRNTSGEALYNSPELSFVQKAGLLNLLAKMGSTPLPDGSKILDHVDSVYRLRGDRVFAKVAVALRDLVKTGAVAQLFNLVDGSLHKPDVDFQLVDSYKTPDPYGNLQITFFSSLNPPLRFTADIDIDDAAGIGHIFQVVEHTVKKTVTNPYDIHEILVYHQVLDPGYQLVLT